MPQVVANQQGVRALVSQGEAAGVPEHVGVDRDGDPRELAVTSDEIANLAPAEWSSALAQEKVRIIRCGPDREPALEEPRFVRPQRVRGPEASLEPVDVELPGLEVHLVEPEGASLRDPQTVPEHEEEQRAIAGLVTGAGNGGEEPSDLLGREMFSALLLKWVKFAR